LHQFKGFVEFDLGETIQKVFEDKKIELTAFPKVFFQESKQNAQFESLLDSFIRVVQGNSVVGNKHFNLDVLAKDLPQIIKDGIVLADNPGVISFEKGENFINRYLLNERSRIALFSEEAELAKADGPSARGKVLIALRKYFNDFKGDAAQKTQLLEHAQRYIVAQKNLALVKMELLSRIRQQGVPEEIENVLLENLFKHVVNNLKKHRSQSLESSPRLLDDVINKVFSADEDFIKEIQTKKSQLLGEIYFANSDFEGGITKNKGKEKAKNLFESMLGSLETEKDTSYLKNLPHFQESPLIWHRTPMHLRGRTKAFNINFALMGADELASKIKDEIFLLLDEYRRLKKEGDAQITLKKLFLSLDEQVTSGYKTISRKFYNENGVRFEMAPLIERLTEKFDTDFSNDYEKSNQEILPH
jgi:hypothetical protein